MATEPDQDLTDERSDAGLGGFAEAGSIEPGVDDEQRPRRADPPTAPASPSDEPASNGPLNPA